MERVGAALSGQGEAPQLSTVTFTLLAGWGRAGRSRLVKNPTMGELQPLRALGLGVEPLPNPSEAGTTRELSFHAHP
jgi:hypothetical protein